MNWSSIPTRKLINGKIMLNPNDWDDALYWYEDEPKVYDFMLKYEVNIKRFAEKNDKTLKDSIDILFKIDKDICALFDMICLEEDNSKCSSCQLYQDFCLSESISMKKN